LATQVSALRVVVVDDLAQFLSLQKPWEALELSAGTSSIFVSWNWQFLWWKHYGGNGSLRVLVAMKSDAVVGILPLYVQRARSHHILPIRVLRLVGTGGDTAPDHLDPLIHPAFLEAVALEFASCLCDTLRDWDVLLLSDLAPDRPLVQALQEVFAAQGRALHVETPSRIPFGHLPLTWDLYLASLSSSRRQAIRQSRKKFETAVGGRFYQCTDNTKLTQIFQRLSELHRMRWEGRSKHHSFASPRYLAFHQALVETLGLTGQLRLYCLEVAERVIAVLYCYRYKNTLCYFQSGFDPSLSDISPGQVLIAYVIENAIAEGCDIFDMLKGDYGHKRHFVKESRLTTAVSAYQGMGHFVRMSRVVRDRLASVWNALPSLFRAPASATKEAP
jgi:CelD/BcsL family acetyltransferase involved in cellulose biosynthesis